MPFITSATEPVNQFRPILKLISFTPTPDHPNYEAMADIELFGTFELRQLQIGRNRRGEVFTSIPLRRNKPAYWIKPELKYQFDQAIAEILPAAREVPRG